MNKIETEEFRKIFLFMNEHNKISPWDMDEILDDLYFMGFLNEKGVDFRDKFWNVFIKTKGKK